MKIDPQEFSKLKAEAESFYKTIGEVYCPYFNENIAFNAKGLNHVKLKEWNKSRIVEDQYLRLKFLYLAPEITKKSNTLQELRKQNKFERQKINSRWEQRMVSVKYYAFIAIMKNIKTKVIIKEIEGNKKYFWSICPYWKQRKRYDGTTEKALFEGNLETD